MSDPRKREIYDKYGEEGLSFLESGMFGEDGNEILPFLMNPKLIGLVICALMLIVAVIVLVPVFIVVRTDRAVKWNWGVVFIPIWILLAPIVLFACGRIFLTKGSKISAFLFALQTVMVTLFLAFICARLNNADHWPAQDFLSPLFVIEGLGALKRLRKSTHESYRNEAQQADDKTSKRSYLGLGYGGYLIRVWFWWVHRAVFLVLLTVQLDDHKWSWWIPAIPIITAMFLGFLIKRADDKVQKVARLGTD